MSIESKGAPGLNYAAFRNRLALEGFSGQQNVPLKLRLELLESFMEEPPKPGTSDAKPAFPATAAGREAAREWERETKAKAKAWSFEPGSLTIVDLSCPFVDDGAACALFAICLELFLENHGDVGRVLALDEAHKARTLIVLFDK